MSQTFRVEVPSGNLLGDDANFSPTSSFNPTPVSRCTLKQLEPTIIAPIQSTTSRNAELQHYDLVANAIANSAEWKQENQQQDNKNSSSSIAPDAFKSIMLLTDVQHQNAVVGGTTASSSPSSKPWEGKVLDERYHVGERYFLPSAKHTQPIMLYHNSLKEYRHLYAGRVVGVFGTVVTRDNNTGAIVAVMVNRILTTNPAPTTTTTSSDLNPNAALLASNTAESKEIVNSLAAQQQRIHFCPIPPHLEGDDGLVDDFLRDTIRYLTVDRSSSLIVFVGALIGKIGQQQRGGGNNNNNKATTVYKSNMANKMRETIRIAAVKAIESNNNNNNNTKQQHQQQRPTPPSPLMFVPGIDDAALRPSVIPQYNLVDVKTIEPLIAGGGGSSAAASSSGFVHLPSNPAIFHTNGTNETNGLTIVATSIDIQNAYLSHSMSKEIGQQQQQHHPRPTKLDVSAETLLQSGLCVPFIQDKYDDEEFFVEPSSLSELTVTPHIHFSPTSVKSEPQAFLHKNGTLFVSCNVGPSSFMKDGKCSVIEVDVTSTLKNKTQKIMSNENVRVRTINFIRYK